MHSVCLIYQCDRPLNAYSIHLCYIASKSESAPPAVAKRPGEQAGELMWRYIEAHGCQLGTALGWPGQQSGAPFLGSLPTRGA